jgi:hypothetical protein
VESIYNLFGTGIYVNASNYNILYIIKDEIKILTSTFNKANNNPNSLNIKDKALTYSGAGGFLFLATK